MWYFIIIITQDYNNHPHVIIVIIIVINIMISIIIVVVIDIGNRVDVLMPDVVMTYGQFTAGKGSIVLSRHEAEVCLDGGSVSNRLHPCSALCKELLRVRVRFGWLCPLFCYFRRSYVVQSSEHYQLWMVSDKFGSTRLRLLITSSFLMTLIYQ